MCESKQKTKCVEQKLTILVAFVSNPAGLVLSEGLICKNDGLAIGMGTLCNNQTYGCLHDTNVLVVF